MEGGRTRVQLCGRLEALIEGTRIEQRLRGRQGRLLFAFLVLHRDRPVRRDELAEAIGAADDARLAPPLSRLRSALGPGRIEGRTELALVLPADAWVDWEAASADLAAARAALAAGATADARDAAGRARAIAEQGLLPGLEAPWIDDKRAELGELRLEALEVQAAAAVRLGGGDLALAERAARAAVEAAPFRESARLVLMEALRAQGNAAEALRAFEDARVLLREELGASPGPRLAALHQELLALDRAPAQAAPAAPAPPPVAADGLVGRDRERAQLSSLLRDTLAGDGRVAIVEGPAGIGKSRLLAAVRAEAEAAGALVAAARASQLERDFPFGVVRQLFEGRLADPAERTRLLAGAAAPAAAVFSVESGSDAPGDGSFAALHGLYWLALNLAAARPLLLAVDDLHWVDAPSLRFLAYLSRRLEGQPVLLLGTLRSGEAAVDAALLAELLQDGAVGRVRPAPLDEPTVGALVRARLGAEPDPAFRRACHTTTGGNPLLLRQLLSALEADRIRPDAAHADTVRAIGSRAVASTVHLRLERLSADAATVAKAIAVLGEDAALPAVAALAGLPEPRVAAATADLARAEILQAGGGRTFAFVHPLVLDAAASLLGPGERELAHARAAVILRDAAGTRERIATHLLVAPGRGEPWVVELLRACAAGALRTGGAESAAAYLRRALAEPPPPAEVTGLSLELGMAEALTNAPAAIGHLQAAYAGTQDPLTRALIARILGRAMMFSGDAPGALRLARSTAAALPDALEDERRALEAFALICVYFEGGAVEEIARAREHRHLELGAGAGARMLAAVASLQWAYSDGSAAEAGALAHAALADGTLVREDNGLLSIAATCVLEMAGHPAVMDFWDAAMLEGHARGSLFSISSVHLWRGFTLMRRGDLVDAIESLEQALDEFELYGYGADAKLYAGGFLALSQLAASGPAAARRTLERTGPPLTYSNGSRFWRTGRLTLLVQEGRAEEARRLARELRARHGWIDNPSDSPWRSLEALALERLGRRDEALAAAEEELAAARRWGAPGTVGPALRVLGTVRRDPETLEEAVELLAASPRRLELAVALAAHGEALAATGAGAAGRERLSRAHTLATICSATAVAADIAARLRAAGGAPEPVVAAGLEALTLTEHRAAALAAEGADERDVAQALFLTPHAAQVRLASAQAKLGVHSRDELAEALAG